MVRVDLADEQDNIPKVFKISREERDYFQYYFEGETTENKIDRAKRIVLHHLNKLNGVDVGDLERYVKLIVSSMNQEQMEYLERSPVMVAYKIKRESDATVE